MSDNDEQQDPPPDPAPPIKDVPALQNVEKRGQEPPPVREVPELRNSVLGGGDVKKRGR